MTAAEVLVHSKALDVAAHNVAAMRRRRSQYTQRDRICADDEERTVLVGVLSDVRDIDFDDAEVIRALDQYRSDVLVQRFAQRRQINCSQLGETGDQAITSFRLQIVDDLAPLSSGDRRSEEDGEA